ncbi:hypothetical protein [Nocardioides sp. TF02-7]|uniref:hypothetical protein n=1 Tax=Nocardioides sp. TF02-7 TaxID=2917724 RepID=UPI001F05ED18|nr:hypothetical protein [Nocardioides sp. TF02-7]UMG93965.1 hypothetical protein MF408_07715 [Nocardioides sp. TF02-7]
MNDRVDLTVFGATSRQFVRRLLPALTVLEQDGLLEPAGRVVAVSSRPLDRSAYRAGLRRAVQAALGDSLEDGVVDRLLARVDRVELDPTNEVHWSRLARTLERNGSLDGGVHLFGLPRSPVGARLVCAGLRRWELRRPRSGALLEAPVGHNLGSARGIARAVTATFAEDRAFRLDPVLGEADRLRSSVLGRAGPVDHVQVTVARAEAAATDPGHGVLRHMVQSHGLSLVSAVAMAPATRPGAEAVRDARLEVLRSLRPMTEGDVDRWTVRGRAVPPPRPGHRPRRLRDTERRTETFVALRAEVDAPGWDGVPFYLRTGTGLRSDACSVVVAYADGERAVWHAGASEGQEGSGRAGSVREHPAPAAVVGARARARLLLDAVDGDLTRLVRGDEVEAAWEWVEPIARRWERSPGRPAPYAGGGIGPLDAAHLLGREGREWHEVA